MSSAELDGQTKKRYREEELVLDDFSSDPWECLSKKVCTVSRAMEDNQHDYNVLDDFYDLVTLPEGNILESDTQEELVSEMMRSLERVIANEETSLLQSTYGPSSEESLNTSLREKSQFFQEDCRPCTKHGNKAISIRDSPVDMKFLFEASDDELGIPPSPNSVGQKVCYLPDDSSWLDTNYPELTVQTVNWQSVPEKDIESWRRSSGNNSWVVENLEMERTIASEEENRDLGLSFDCLL